MFKAILSICFISIGLHLVHAQTDTVIDALKKTEKAYLEKDYKNAGLSLQEALIAMQSIIGNEVASCLPGNIEGWKRGEPNISAANEIAFGMSDPNTFSVEISYASEQSAQNVNITLSNIPHIVQIAKAGIQLQSNPFFVKMSEEGTNPEKTEEYKFDNYQGIQKVNQTAKTVEYILFVHETLIEVRGSNIEEAQSIEQFLKSLDIKHLEEISKS